MFQDFMPQALSKAKDESLADMQGKHAGYTFTYLDNLCKQNGTYDYFKIFYDRFFIKVPEELKKAIWSRYVERLKYFVRSAEKFQEAGKSAQYNLWQEVIRTKDTLFPYVLAQIPIERWDVELEFYMQGRQRLIGRFQELYQMVDESMHGSIPNLSLKSAEDVGRDETVRREQTENRVKAVLRQQIVSRTIDAALPDEVLAERIVAVTEQLREGEIKR